MHQGITQYYSSKSPFLELNDEEFASVLTAHKRSFQILFIEEKFTYLVENYYDLERALLTSSLKTMHFPYDDKREIFNNIHYIIRLIINLLTTARLYIDQTFYDLKNIVDDGGILEKEFKVRLSEKHKSSFSFRLCENLRNHIQHKSIPISGIKNCSNGIYIKEKRKLIHHVEITLNTHEFGSDCKLNKNFREELEEQNHKINLRPILCDYICHIAEVHEWLRPNLKRMIEEHNQTIINAIEQYKNFANITNSKAIVLAKETKDFEIACFLMPDNNPLERFNSLGNKYNRISCINKHFVSNARLD